MIPNLHKFYSDIYATEDSKRHLTRILELFQNSFNDLNIQGKMRIINLMRVCKTYNNKLLDSVLIFAEMNFTNLNYDDLLNIMITNHGARRVTPFEMLYKMRNRFNETFRELKPGTVIKTLGLFCKNRMVYTETFYENIFRILFDDAILKDFTSIDCVLTLNYYSKIKYRDQEFMEKFISKIEGNLKPLNEIQLKILLFSLAELNYKNDKTYTLMYQQFNLLKLIKEMKEEKGLTQFEQDYFQTIIDIIAPQASSAENISVDQVEGVKQ